MPTQVSESELTTQQQQQQLTAEFNLLSRKYSIIKERLLASEDSYADFRARAESEVLALRATVDRLTSQLETATEGTDEGTESTIQD